MLKAAGKTKDMNMKSLLTLPIIAFLALTTLAACDRQAGSGNNSGEQQKPISPAKPSN